MQEEKYFPQKFAGNILLSHIAVETLMWRLPKYYPEEGYHIFHDVNVNGNTNYCIYEWESLHRLGDHILKKIEAEPGFLDHVFEVWRAKTAELKEYERHLDSVDLRTSTDQEIKEMFKKIIYLLQEEYALPMLCDAFSLHSEPILIDRLRELVKDEKKVASYLSILIAPVYESFTNREVKSLFRIMVEIEKEPGVKDRLMEGDLESLSPKISDMVEEHCNRFFWITNGYHQGIKVGRDYFLQQICESFKEGISPAKTLMELEHSLERNRMEKERLMGEQGFDIKLRSFIRSIEEFTFMHDERKGLMIEAYYYIEEILREISRRVGLTLDELNACFHTEIPDVMEGRYDIDEIRRRMELFYFVLDDKDIRCFTGEEAAKRKSILLPEAGQKKEILEIRGNPASLGIAVGRVRIIPTAREIGKIQKGDILVTGMTRPDYIIALKKAAAIVTDEGGITSHAAIVSRELGIPCVIGTKDATTMLKDGMLVEVNANHGRIRILEKN
jgi:phosphoenolpyruvate synthase/pyruvate phosphate dikinase